jgi:hypothetical protein
MNWFTLYLVMGWVVVGAFAITFVVAILAICGKIQMEATYRGRLFTTLILEIVAAAFFLFRHGVGQVPPYDISGIWRYTCTASDTSLQVGGYCTIAKRENGGEVDWDMGGERLWKRTWTETSTNFQTFDKGVPWDSRWSHILGEDQLKFRYSIRPPGENKSIEGYGEGRIEATNRIGFAISGTFFQLPPDSPLYGTMKFERIQKREDAYVK